MADQAAQEAVATIAVADAVAEAASADATPAEQAAAEAVATEVVAQAVEEAPAAVQEAVAAEAVAQAIEEAPPAVQEAVAAEAVTQAVEEAPPAVQEAVAAEAVAQAVEEAPPAVQEAVAAEAVAQAVEEAPPAVQEAVAAEVVAEAIDDAPKEVQEAVAEEVVAQAVEEAPVADKEAIAAEAVAQAVTDAPAAVQEAVGEEVVAQALEDAPDAAVQEAVAAEAITQVVEDAPEAVQEAVAAEAVAQAVESAPEPAGQVLNVQPTVHHIEKPPTGAHELAVEQNGGFQHHVAFIGAGSQPGLEVWRIENFEPVKQSSRANSGEFYNGDAYIVLNTIGVGKQLSHDIHFWLGKKVSQDESGSAAIHTVELDEYLGGAAVQHREVQSHESKRFLSYFKKGIKYLDGGAKSGFVKVERGKYVKRLFQCKGKHTCRVEQVELKCASLNQGDVFILDAGPNIFVWIGPLSSRMERLKAMDMARGFRDEDKAGRAHIHVVDSDWNTNAAFFKALGSHDKVIRSPVKDDEEAVRKLDQETLLYKIAPTPPGSAQEATITEVGALPFKQDLLDSNNCYVLDSGYSGIYVWTGKTTDMDFRKRVWTAVNEFLNDRGYPAWAAVSRVIDGGETPLFKQYFADWTEEDAPVAPIADDVSGDNVAKQEYNTVDGSSLHGQRPPKAQQFMPDDGSGKLTVYRVGLDNELIKIPEHAHGVFFGGDCYVLHYEYLGANGRPAHIIYFWQGMKAEVSDRGASALNAMRLDDELGGEAVQVRVVMNKEPDHFMKIFGGRLIIFMEGHINGYRSIKDHDLFNPLEALMFRIHGDHENNTRAIQVECRGASLNANDVFIVETDKKIFVWVGKHSETPVHEMAKFMVQFTSPGRGEPVIVMEGEETQGFWDAIGGEEAYYTGIRKESKLRTPVRLFHCSNSSGRFVVEEVVNFSQEDLDEDDVMMLDTCDEIFVWIGSGANEFEKKEAMKTSYTYLQSDPTGRNAENTLIIVVRQGFEPPQFTGHFMPWDTELWNNGKTFAEMVEEVGTENAGINLLEDEAKKYSATYPLDVLQRKIPPEGIDVTKKELYLSDEDFEVVFGMSKSTYQTLPAWKRTMMRKAKGLF